MKPFLLDNVTGQAVEASLVDSVSKERLIQTHLQWQPVRLQALSRLTDAANGWPEHWHWDWSKKAQKLNYSIYRCIGIECEGSMQGLMLVRTLSTRSCRLPSQLGKSLLYIEYIETAPWNLLALAEAPKFAGVGTRLMEAAVACSEQEGFSGRLGLHSLPQSQGFYARYLSDLGPDPEMEGMHYFEMTPEGATAFIYG